MKLESIDKRERWYIYKKGSDKSWKNKYRFSLEAAKKLATEMEATNIIHVIEENYEIKAGM